MAAAYSVEGTSPMDAEERKRIFELRREIRRRERVTVASFVQAVADGDADAMGRAVSEVNRNCVWKPALHVLVRRGIGGSEELRRHLYI
jgi:hypothetical protein